MRMEHLTPIARQPLLINGLEVRVLPGSPLFSNSFPEQMGHVPAGVGCQSQQEHQPPEDKYCSHPDLVLSDAQSLRQNARARSQQDVQSADFGHASERGVCGRQPIVSLAKFARYFWTYMNMK